MAMKHDACTHARTPAGRAACRRDAALEGRRQSTAERNAVPAQKKGIGPMAGRAYDSQMSDAPRKARSEAPESVRKAAARVTGTNRRRDNELTPLRRTDDLNRLAVPERLHPPIRFAWVEGWRTQTGSPWNDAEKVIQITNDHGTLSLVWSKEDDDVTDVQWRAADTSITRRITDADLKLGVALLSGN